MGRSALVRPHRDDRRDRAQHRTGEPDDRAAPEPASAPAAILALQRAAGNAAVGKLLRDTRKLPDDPHSLTEVASAAKSMSVDTDDLQLGDLHQWFKGPRGPDRDGVSVTVRFGGDMAAKPDPKAEKVLRDGLGGIAVAAFNLQSIATKDILADTVRTRDLDLSPFGGKDGHYRFTSVTRAANAKKAPTEIDVIVELIRARPAELKPWKALSGDRRLELQNRFSRPGYTQAQPSLTKVVDTWTDDQFGAVLQALEAIPEPMLAGVPDIVWERGHGKLGPTGEAGYFQYTTKPLERRITIYDDAFSTDAGLVETISHEIGHAISDKPSSLKAGAAPLAQSAEFKKAIKDDGGKAITAYGGKNIDEHYAEAYSLFVTEPETLQALRPHVYDYFAGLQGAAAKTKQP
jgi:hypothetical protein